MIPVCVKETDPQIAAVIQQEIERQEMTIELIASENAVSPAVMAVQGSLLTNKYAEGYPHKRYYGGCEYVDQAESLAIERACTLFDCNYANVQPHSGSQANMGVYFALLKPGDTVLGMNLAHGGHLTHGSPINFSGSLYNFVHYGVVRESGLIDYDNLAKLAHQHRPRLIVAGASSYPRVIDFKALAEIAALVDAQLMVDMAHIAGLVVAGVHPSPLPFADVVTSTTHKTLRGPRGGLILSNKDLSKKINAMIFPGIQGGPLMHVIAAKALAFKEAQTQAFIDYQHQIVANARALAHNLMNQGIKLVSDGTDNHLMLLDLTQLGIDGKTAQDQLECAGITANRNVIPFDQRSPAITSGIRIGTPAITTRGMQAPEMEIIADLIVKILNDPQNDNVIKKVRQEVNELCKAFPLYAVG